MAGPNSTESTPRLRRTIVLCVICLCASALGMMLAHPIAAQFHRSSPWMLPAIAVGVLVGTFGLVRLLFVLFPEPDLKKVQWAELLAVILVPETIFIVSALVLWRKRRSMAVGIVMSAVTLVAHVVFHVTTH